MRYKSAHRGAHFTWSLRSNVVCITDREKGMSVTNDAENVIATIVAAGVDPSTHRFIYKDTEGRWDELVVHHGRFDGFRFIGVTELSEALRHLSEHTSRARRTRPRTT